MVSYVRPLDGVMCVEIFFWMLLCCVTLISFPILYSSTFQVWLHFRKTYKKTSVVVKWKKVVKVP